eukprot:TRINITY_DN28033_c0_g1_i1.p1 TRINITY_DN28033_c0_g1~~TRINITY_DN28033_c0_g1_i1.p1  ORF type:complete len:172 (+),score=29.04 TRINITY_DN28033_c0_g1_i1:43-558(+)
MTTIVHFSATQLDTDLVRMTLSVISRKKAWLFNLLQKCPSPKAKPIDVEARSQAEGDVSLDQRGTLVEYSPGSWKIIVPSSRIDHPKNSPIIEAIAERSVNGSARTAVWLEKEMRKNGDTLYCKDDLAETLRQGPGKTLTTITGVRSNERFLQEQEALQREAKRPRLSLIS